jgi:hypothetical protein
MHITRYEIKEYVDGYKIIDIDKASSLQITQDQHMQEDACSSGILGDSIA